MKQQNYSNSLVGRFGYSQKINDTVTDNPAEPINLVGHSYGGHTAAQIASKSPVPINNLITVDPVGRGEIGSFRSNVKNWVNVTANPSSRNFSDTIASLGGKGAGLTLGKANASYSVDTNHANFGTMMTAPGVNGFSAQNALSQNASTVGSSPSQNLGSFNPAPPSKH